jgi:hypothetical protein
MEDKLNRAVVLNVGWFTHHISEISRFGDLKLEF